MTPASTTTCSPRSPWRPATDDDLDCVACDEDTCTDPDHNEPAVKIRQWRGLAQKLAALRCGTEPVAVAYNRDAARRWLTEWAADEFGIDESFSTLEVTIVARLEDLLAALAWNAQPQVWATRPPLACVQLWRTADGDGVDGGAMITADLRLGERTVRIGTRHQGSTTSSTTRPPAASTPPSKHSATSPTWSTVKWPCCWRPPRYGRRPPTR